MENVIAKTKETDHANEAAPRRSKAQAAPELHPALQLQQQAGNQAMQQLLRSGAIHAKLAVSQPGDPEEQEADAVADRIMRSPVGPAAAATPCSCGTHDEGMCDECRQKTAGISRKAAGSGSPRASHPVVDTIKRSSGKPLDAPVRALMESRLGHDFGDVRVHTDALAAESAQSVNALAYTAGKDLVFGEGQYAPGDSAGQKLLAHELVHVVQQDGDAGANRIQRQPSGTKQQPPPLQQEVDWHPGMFARVVKDFLGYGASGMVTYKVGEIFEVTSEPQGFGTHNEVQVVLAALPGRPRGTHFTSVGVENLVPTSAPEVPKSGTPRFRGGADLTKMSISPEWARALSTPELGIQQTFLRTYLSEQSSSGSTGADYLAVQQNLQVLQDEQLNRAARWGGLGSQPQFVPRPAGLPLDGSYTLQELSGISADIAAQIPEGQVVTLSEQALKGNQPATSQPPALLPGLGGGSWAGLRGADTALTTFGLAPAGDYAIGLVAIPPASPNPFGRYPNYTVLENPFELAGHTALYVRQGGKITIVRGYNPRMRWGEPSTIWDLLKDYGKIFGGKKGVSGDITEDFGMFRSTSARTVEYPVTPDVAAEFLGQLPPLGTPAPGEPPLYSAPPSEYANTSGTPVGCEGTNCGLWATQKIEGPLGARVGLAGQDPIVDIPVPGQAAQGKLYGMMDPSSSTPLIEMPGATGPGIRGGVSGGLTVLQWGGRGFMVAGGVKMGYDILTAPEGERGHVAFVEGSGFVGGMLGGAALGLVCGPGAPVCCVITGIVGGIAGAEAASTLAEAMWSFPQAASYVASDLEERKLQQLVERSGGTMPPAVQDAARRSGLAILFAP